MRATIGQYATRPVIVVDADSTVLDALRMMSRERISCVVVTIQNEAVGIITERDVVFATNWVLGQPDLKIREVMNKPVMTGSEDMQVTKAHQIFREHQIRHLVVLDQKLDMVGVFTQTDLVRSLQDSVFSGIEDVSGLMTSQVKQVTPDAPARYALSLMARHAISCVVVMEDHAPVGIFTERDAVRLVAEGVDLATHSVGEVMSTSIVTTPVATPPHKTIVLMRKNKVRRLIVLDEEGALAGLLTQTDLGRALDRPAAEVGVASDRACADIREGRPTLM